MATIFTLEQIQKSRKELTELLDQPTSNDANYSLFAWVKANQLLLAYMFLNTEYNKAVQLAVFNIGQRVRKKSGSSWRGKVVGYYQTELTPVGYCVESEYEPGSVQIYPAAALEAIE